jgi:hypothetical protein
MLTVEKGFRRMVRSLAIALCLILAVVAQTRLDFPQQVKGLPSVVLIQRAVCIQTPAPGATGGDCTGLNSTGFYSRTAPSGSWWESQTMERSPRILSGLRLHSHLPELRPPWEWGRSG